MQKTPGRVYLAAGLPLGAALGTEALSRGPACRSPGLVQEALH